MFILYINRNVTRNNNNNLNINSTTTGTKRKLKQLSRNFKSNYDALWSNENTLNIDNSEHHLLIQEKIAKCKYVMDTLVKFCNSYVEEALYIFDDNIICSTNFIGINHPYANGKPHAPVKFQGKDKMPMFMKNWQKAIPDLIMYVDNLIIFNDGKNCKADVKFSGSNIFHLKFPVNKNNGVCEGSIPDVLVSEDDLPIIYFGGYITINLDDNNKIIMLNIDYWTLDISN